MFEKKEKRMKELKDLCHFLLIREVENDGILLNIYPMTIFEYYKSDFFSKKTVLQKIRRMFEIRNSGGFLDVASGYVLLFIDRLGKDENIYSVEKMAAVIFAVYHEYRHLLQSSDERNSLERILIDVEMKKNVVMFDNYLENHDNFFIECDADLYALNKTKDFFKEYDLDNYDSALKYLKELEESVKFRLNNFDYQRFFDEFYELCEQKNIKVSEFNNSILNIFYDEFNKFRSLKEIASLSLKHKIDNKIICGIVGSNYFLEQLDYSNLENEERQMIFEVLNMIINDEVKRYHINTELYKNGISGTKLYLSLCDLTAKKVTYLEDKCEKLGMKQEFNFSFTKNR